MDRLSNWTSPWKPFSVVSLMLVHPNGPASFHWRNSGIIRLIVLPWGVHHLKPYMGMCLVTLAYQLWILWLCLSYRIGSMTVKWWLILYINIYPVQRNVWNARLIKKGLSDISRWAIWCLWSFSHMFRLLLLIELTVQVLRTLHSDCSSGLSSLYIGVTSFFCSTPNIPMFHNSRRPFFLILLFLPYFLLTLSCHVFLLLYYRDDHHRLVMSEVSKCWCNGPVGRRSW
jgi:hypothetical protein